MSARPQELLPASLERLRETFEARPPCAPETQSVQVQALARFLSRGFPTQREEDWRYTNLRRLESRSFQLSDAQPSPAPHSLPDFGAARLVFVNGMYSPACSESSCNGLRVRTWTRAASVDAELTRRVLQQPPGARDNAFRDLNTAFLDAAVLMELAPGIDCSRPVHLLHVWTMNPPARMSHPRLVIRVGRGSRLTLIEHYLGAVAAEHFTNAQTMVTVEALAELIHCRVQEEAERAFHIGAVHSTLQRESRYHFTELVLGAGLGRTDLDIRLEEPGCRAEVDGLFFPRGTQHLDVHTRIEHIAPHTWSDENYRGIADERGRGVFSGKAVVHPGAQKIEAHQSSRNLLLSAQAEIDSKPDLEIYANDVKCSHGATTGRLDPVSLFYLRSRGIGEQEARVLLMHAFAASVLSAVPGEALRSYLHERLAQKLSLPLEVPA
jgi:Fe-S cluster assembly protein SufD